MKKIKILITVILLGTQILLICSCKKDDIAPAKIKDADGNIYTSVTIGTQVWMVENLKTTKFNDGTSIPNVTNNAEWISLITPGYCWYNNEEANKNTYGALYNWYTVDTDKLCPTGWRVAKDEDWTTLTNYLGDPSIAGSKLKATAGWYGGGNGATNSYGFSALPGGLRYEGIFYNAGDFGYWWTRTNAESIYAWHRRLSYENEEILRTSLKKNLGFSVRCIKN